MPFSFTPKSAGDLIRSQDWNAAMTAISALYDKLNAATGHRHTGGVEDAPQIPTAGIADLAVITAKLADLVVTTNKLANLAVTNAKLAAGAVDITKMQNNSVGSPQIIDGSVTTNELADLAVVTNKLMNLAVTTAKLADESVTAAKLAPGAVAEYGFSVGVFSHGQTVPVPPGFIRSECIYQVGLRSIVISDDQSTGFYRNIYGFVNGTTGVVTCAMFTITGLFPLTFGYVEQSDFSGELSILTIAKKGGW